MPSWKATYNDGTVLSQYNDDGSDNRYSDIDRKNLLYFDLIDGSKLLIRYYFTPDKQLIYRKRVFKQSDGQEQVVYLVGWQTKIHGINVQSVSVLFPSGEVMVIDGWKDDIVLRAPVPHKDEGELWE